jgi:hypothetical protein
MFLKCYHHLHPAVGLESEFVEQTMDAHCNFDIFETVEVTSEPSKKIVKRKLLIFKHYQVNVKEITCLLRLWEKYQMLFLIVGFLVWQILGILGSQIEIERILFSARILINLRRCHL